MSKVATMKARSGSRHSIFLGYDRRPVAERPDTLVPCKVEQETRLEGVEHHQPCNEAFQIDRIVGEASGDDQHILSTRWRVSVL